MENTTTIKELEVNGKVYVLKGSAPVIAEPENNLPFVLVRTKASGVFFGYLKSRDKQEATMVNARMVWSWEGACSLLQMATDGVTKPEACRFTERVISVDLTDVISVFTVTQRAKECLEGVKVWKK